jgi:hypothetical protein
MNVGSPRDAIIARPWTAMAMAFAAGGLLALSRSRNAAVRAAADLLVAAAIPVARELATRQLDDRLRSWFGAATLARA